MPSRRVWLRLELPEKELKSLQQTFGEVDFEQRTAAAIEPSWLETIDIVFTDVPLPDSEVARMANLKWLHVTRGGGYAFLTPALMRRPIQVTTSTGVHGPAFSEFAVACIFALAKRLPECWQAQKDKKSVRGLVLEEVSGKTLGVVGLGTIGSAVASMAKGLGLRVIATKRRVEIKPDYVDELGPPDYLPTLLSSSDFVVACVAGVPSTDGMLGEKEFRAMKRSAYFINLTSGKIAEEKVLVRALKEGWIRGAILNALPQEPLPQDSELWSLPNVTLCGRLPGGSQQWDVLMPIFTGNLKRFISGEPLRNLIDKKLGY
jgi:phosphoglycerate dehydrogenase-like enzyme